MNKFIYWLKIILLVSVIVAFQFLSLCAGVVLGNSKKFADVLDSNYNVSSTVQTQSIGLQPMDTQTNVSEFLSSPFLLPFSPVLAGTRNTVDNISFSNIQFKFFSDGTVSNFSYKVGSSYLNVENQHINNSIPFNVLSWSNIVVSNDDNWHDLVLTDYDGYPLSNTYEFKVTYKCSRNFISIVSYVEIFSVTNAYNQGLSGVNLKFVDVDSNTFDIQLLGPSGVYKNSFLNYIPTRTVYFASNLTDNDYYNSGYDYGYREGQSRGEELGYETGSRDGQVIGEQIGYRRGLADANTYSFGNFFAGLFDAPVTIVYNALNFDLLGVNLYTFFCGLITVFLCIALIKFIRGK